MKPPEEPGRSGSVDLLAGQETAVAKLAYAVERPGIIAVLCGPPGTGKTLVLEAVARSVETAGRSCLVVALQAVGGVPTEAWPDVILVDDADDADDEGLAAMIGTCRTKHPRTSIVVAGSGRLLTLISRDPRLEQAVELRAVLGSCHRTDTRRLVAPVMGAGPPADAVVDTIHEIGGGIPSRILRLAELAALVAADDASLPLTADTIERVHARLAVTAA